MCRQAAAVAAAALEVHRRSPAVQRGALALQEQIQAAWQDSAWLDDDGAGAAFDGPGDAAAVPAAGAAHAAAALPAAALQWATRGLGWAGAPFCPRIATAVTPDPAKCLTSRRSLDCFGRRCSWGSSELVRMQMLRRSAGCRARTCCSSLPAAPRTARLCCTPGRRPALPQKQILLQPWRHGWVSCTPTSAFGPPYCCFCQRTVLSSPAVTAVQGGWNGLGPAAWHPLSPSPHRGSSRVAAGDACLHICLASWGCQHAILAG